MNDSNIDHLMLKFLKQHYPITRTNINGRFKKTIVIYSNQIYKISDEKEYKTLAYKLVEILDKVFGNDEPNIMSVIAEHIHLK